MNTYRPLKPDAYLESIDDTSLVIKGSFYVASRTMMILVLIVVLFISVFIPLFHSSRGLLQALKLIDFDLSSFSPISNLWEFLLENFTFEYAALLLIIIATSYWALLTIIFFPVWTMQYFTSYIVFNRKLNRVFAQSAKKPLYRAEWHPKLLKSGLSVGTTGNNVIAVNNLSMLLTNSINRRHSLSGEVNVVIATFTPELAESLYDFIQSYHTGKSAETLFEYYNQDITYWNIYNPFKKNFFSCKSPYDKPLDKSLMNLIYEGTCFVMVIPIRIISIIPYLYVKPLFALLPEPKMPELLKELAQLQTEEELSAFYKKHNIPEY